MWQTPIQDKNITDQINSKIDEICECLYHENYSNDSIGLLSGMAGKALFFAYYGKQKNNPKYIEKAGEILSDVMDQINTSLNEEINGVNPVLSTGISGIFWAITHLIKHDFIEGDSEELFSDLDEYLGNYMLMLLDSDKGYDFLHGSSGIAFYLLSKEKINPKTEALINKYIDALYKKGIIENNTIKWKSTITNVGNISEIGFNLSLSHGMASIIALLNMYIKKLGTSNKTSNEMLRYSVNYVMNYIQDPKNDGVYFPTWISDVEVIKHSRLAWCYGDLGIAYVLLESAELLKDNELKNKCIEILLFTASRKDAQKEKVVDSGICHGAMGLTQIYNRLYNKTSIHQFSEIAQYWSTISLQQSIYKDGYAGFKSYQGVNGWNADSSFLEGIAGIGLCMMSITNSQEPFWDECLLLS